ncbi:MAG: hypothetical protein PHW96_04825 [Candidatus Nanoarchaeia archaeon]|nr:hypothetical protein [Candidatus Nanoarchaeia archaeon]
MSRIFNLLKSRLLHLKKKEKELEKENLTLENDKKRLLASLESVEKGVTRVTKELNLIKKHTKRLKTKTRK